MAKNKRTFGGAIEKSILYNRNVLYFIFALALGYLFYMSTTYDYYSLSIFVIVGFLTSFFSKNMIVILSLAMAVSFIFKYGTKIRPEGFEDGDFSETPPPIPPVDPTETVPSIKPKPKETESETVSSTKSETVSANPLNSTTSMSPSTSTAKTTTSPALSTTKPTSNNE